MKANMVGDLLDDNILIPLQAIVGTTPIVSDVCSIDNLDGAGLVLNSTGTVAGTWKVEASNNYVTTKVPNLNQGAQVNSIRWADVTALFGTISGSVGTKFYQCYPLVARAIRVTFTPSSGAGNVSADYCAKGTR
jgi:hypothetical protein